MDYLEINYDNKYVYGLPLSYNINKKDIEWKEIPYYFRSDFEKTSQQFKELFVKLQGWIHEKGRAILLEDRIKTKLKYAFVYRKFCKMEKQEGINRIQLAKIDNLDKDI